MRRTTAALAVACLAGLGLSSPGATPTEEPTRLTHKAHKNWDFVLPAERWKAVGKELVLPGGLTFATATEGPLKLRVDTNADGRVDRDVKGQGGFLTLHGETKSGETVRYSVRFKNVAAGKWEWATGSSMSGKVGGMLIHVFDQDGNGRFDDYGVDAVAIGSSKSASLLSKVVSIDGDLYGFDISPDGSTVGVEPYVGPTGVLNAHQDYEARGKLTAAVFRSGDLSFQVAGESKGVTVPVGKYQFVSGRVERGSAHASIRKGRMGSLEVSQGQETLVDWGEDIGGEFDTKRLSNKLTVQPNFAIYGAAGEEYYDFVPRGKGPKILVKDTKRGRTIQEGRFGQT